MKKKICFILICFSFFYVQDCFSQNLACQTIQREELVNAIHLNWNGDFYQMRSFNTNGNSYSSIKMDLMLFCPEKGCSNWDYTIKTYLVEIVDKDTIFHELGRIMTPYGGYYNWSGNIDKWRQHFYFDVTDYAPLFKDSTLFMVRFEGWQDGFMVNLDFDFKEDPQKTVEVLESKQLYNGYFPYGNVNTPIDSYLPTHHIKIPKGTNFVYVKTIISGHGADSIQACSEFCKKYYKLIVGNKNFVKEEKRYVWKDDCGYNWIQPQGGTWIFDRAGWCPGTKTNEEIFLLKDIDFKKNREFDLRLSFEPDTIYQNGQAGYAIFAEIFFLKVEDTKPYPIIEEIIFPSKQYAQYPARQLFNKIKVVVKNVGSQPMNSFDFRFKSLNAELLNMDETILSVTQTNLNFRETNTFTYNFFEISDALLRAKRNSLLNCQVLPSSTEKINGNNEITDSQTVILSNIIDRFSSKIRFEIFTNDSSSENHLRLLKLDQQNGAMVDRIVWEDSLNTSATLYSKSFTLDKGYYQLIITDSMCDGFSWWFRPEQGSGKIRIVDALNGLVLKTLNPDFGCELRYEFEIDSDFKQESPLPLNPIPTSHQIDWQKMEKYAFIHFGLNTFVDKEWGYGDLSPELFNPSNLNCEQWVQTFAQAGFSGVILTAKHHDGFCLWQTDLSDYSVKSSPWKDGKGDLVAELATACKKYNLKLGLYLSPWDRNHADYGSQKYVDYYHQQWTELTTRYGNLFEVWFDGANGGDGWYGGANEKRNIDKLNYYQFKDVYRLIYANQPQVIIFSDGGPGCRWVGNEKGFAGETNWSFLRGQEVYPGYERYSELTEGHIDGDSWIPSECDVSIRPGWFYHPNEDSLVKTPEQLLDIYYKSVGRNATMLLNFPVNREGKISTMDSANAVKFNKLIRKELSNNILAGIIPTVSNQRGDAFSPCLLTDNSWESYWATEDSVYHAEIIFTLKNHKKMNRLLLQEYIPLGQRVKSFSVEYYDGKQWNKIVTDEEMTTIGYKRILRFETINTDILRINIEDSRAAICISNIQAFFAE